MIEIENYCIKISHNLIFMFKINNILWNTTMKIEYSCRIYLF